MDDSSEQLPTRNELFPGPWISAAHSRNVCNDLDIADVRNWGTPLSAPLLLRMSLRFWITAVSCGFLHDAVQNDEWLQ